MAVSINSKEFADAWRTVSEAILAFVQSCDNRQGQAVDSTENPVPPNLTQTSQPPVNPAVNETPTILDERYATCPIRQEDGTYIFKNLKDVEQDESTYKITRYVDGSCEFELCDMRGERRQVFKDNQTDIMPPKVGTLEGQITSVGTIITINRGKGVVEGRIVRIIEPLEAKIS